MIYAVLGSGIGALALVGTLSVLLYKAQRETMRVRDVLEGERKISATVLEDRGELTKENAVLTALNAELERRLSLAEAARNEANKEAEGHVVEAAKQDPSVVSDLLASNWPAVTGVSPAVPEKPRSESGADALIDPDL